jgi:hypothetical protein
LLRKKAAEELKKEQERKATERRRVIDQRCGKQRPVDGLSKGENRKFANLESQNIPKKLYTMTEIKPR